LKRSRSRRKRKSRRKRPKRKPNALKAREQEGGTSRMSFAKDTDFETRKRIFEEVKRFNRTELEELYKVLRRGSEEVSENRNGMFFDLLSLKDETLEKIDALIVFCKENRANFEVREKALTDLVNSAETE
jgi:hypothetical protein